MKTTSASPLTDYSMSGFDDIKFMAAYARHMKGVPKYNAASIGQLVQLLGMIQRDPQIMDLRWTAYMLATAFVESSVTRRVQAQRTRGGKTVSTSSKVWRNFAPVEEAGRGKTYKYGLPAKVKRLPDGTARVTECDGDEWIVTLLDKRVRTEAINKGAHQGVAPTTLPVPAYSADDGTELSYYGRGLVQLTWWSNYATTGAFLGLGLDLLFEPDRVMEPTMAYRIMATGMRTGAGFANGHKFVDFFIGGHTDYVKARLMVNPGASLANKKEVADVAKRFEAALLESRAGAAGAP